MRSHTSIPAWLVAAALAVCLVQPSSAADSAKEFRARFAEQVQVEETGLPAYPGATPHRETGDEGNGLSAALSLGQLGFKLVVAKFRTLGQPEQVASFYREALSRWGTVLDCNDPKNRRPLPAKDRDQVLQCDSSAPKAGQQVFKVGTPQEQRIVIVQAQGQGGEFRVVQVSGKGAQVNIN
ncbi:MAG: hypothetical protein U5L74_11075 [Ideonella sp.]|nr:hypothetical protein [Ideonella sp.]